MRGPFAVLSFAATLCAPVHALDPSFTTVVTRNATAGTATFISTQQVEENVIKWMGVAVGYGMGSADHAYICAKSDVYTLRRVPLSPYPSGSNWNTYPQVEAGDGSCTIVDDKLVMKFTRPINGSDTGKDQRELKPDGVTKCIFAEGQGSFSKHEKAGGLDINIESGKAAAGALQYDPLIILHMVIMGAAWVVLAPAGIICARYFKSYSPLWFHLHRVLVMLAVLCTIVGVVIGFTQGSHTTTHYKLGIAISAVLLFQPVLGMVRPDKGSDRRRAWYIAHAVFGLVLVTLTVVQVQQGIAILDTAASKKAVPVVAALYVAQALFMLISEGGLQGLYSLPWIKKTAD